LCCLSCFGRSISASAKIYGSSIWLSHSRSVDGQAWLKLRKSCSVVIASLFERRAAGLYHNTAVTLNADGAIAGVYRKMHIPDDPLYYEKFYFAPGIWVSGGGHRVWPRGHAGLLGPVVSRRCAADGAARR
jgi:hypothetical protein